MIEQALDITSVTTPSALNAFITELGKDRIGQDRAATLFSSGLQSLRDQCNAREDRGDAWHTVTTEEASQAVALCYLGIYSGKAQQTFHEVVLPKIWRYTHGGVFREGALEVGINISLMNKLLQSEDISPLDRGVLLYQKGVNTKGSDLIGASQLFEVAANLLHGIDTYYYVCAVRQNAICYRDLRYIDEAIKLAEKADHACSNDPRIFGYGPDEPGELGLRWSHEKDFPTLLGQLYGLKIAEFKQKQEVIVARPTIPLVEQLKCLPGLDLAQTISIDSLIRGAGGTIELVIPLAERSLAEVYSDPGGKIDKMHGHLMVALVSRKVFEYMTAQNIAAAGSPLPFEPNDIADAHDKIQTHLDHARPLAMELKITEGAVPRVIRELDLFLGK